MCQPIYVPGRGETTKFPRPGPDRATRYVLPRPTRKAQKHLRPGLNNPQPQDGNEFHHRSGGAGKTLATLISLRPDLAREIEHCAPHDHELESIREDLAAVEAVMANLDSLPADLREERRAECLDLIAGLIFDIEQRLADTKVVPIAAARHGARP